MMRLRRKQKDFFFLTLTLMSVFFLVYWILFNTSLFFGDKTNLYQFREMTQPMRDQKILVFSPHPDDETIGAGGFIYTAEKNKANVRIVLVTDGNKQKIKSIRYREFTAATGKLGVKKENLVYLNFPDGGLRKIDQTTLKEKLIAQIDDFKPDIIVTSSYYDAHPDHSVIGEYVGDYAQEKKIPVYEYLVHFRGFPKHQNYSPRFHLVPPQSLLFGEWLRFDLSSQAENVKSEAVSSYKSQLAYPPLADLLMGLIKKNEMFYTLN